MDKGAVVLCSGGVDSTTVLAIAQEQGYSLYSLSFCYGQRHKIELSAARKVAQAFNVARHLILDIDLGKIGGSALTENVEVPKDRSLNDIAGGIPTTYVPARNTIFLSYALAWAEVLNIYDIFIGVTAVDYSGYPDCRPEYIEAFETMANLATKTGVERRMIRINAPLIHLSKAQIIKKGRQMGVDYSLTHSCYDPTMDGKACGRCDSCKLRRKGFQEAGIVDPASYVYV